MSATVAATQTLGPSLHAASAWGLSLHQAAQAAGWLAVPLTAASMVSASDLRTRQLLLALFVLLAFNNWGLGAHTAAASFTLSALQCWGAQAVATAPLRARRRLFVLCALTAGVFGYWTWDGPISLVAAVTSVLASYALYLTRGVALRTCLGVCAALSLVTALYFDSPAQLVVHGASIAGAVWGVLALRRQARPAAASA